MKAATAVSTYDDLLRALDERRLARGWSLNALNDYAGLQCGYSEKLHAKIRHLGPVSLPNVLAALNAEITLTPKEP